MVAVNSNMIPLGTLAPSFTLKDVASGKNWALDATLNKKGYLVVFICNHCPFVHHLLPKLAECLNALQEKGFGVFAISSNDAKAYPQDGPDKMAIFAKEHGFQFPYLYDQTQEIAKAYGAACTPDFFLFDENKELVYRGQFDSSRRTNDVPVTGEDLMAAAEMLLSGGDVTQMKQKPSIGCNIKWIAEN